MISRGAHSQNASSSGVRPIRHVLRRVLTSVVVGSLVTVGIAWTCWAITDLRDARLETELDPDMGAYIVVDPSNPPRPREFTDFGFAFRQQGLGGTRWTVYRSESHTGVPPPSLLPARHWRRIDASPLEPYEAPLRSIEAWGWPCAVLWSDCCVSSKPTSIPRGPMPIRIAWPEFSASAGGVAMTLLVVPYGLHAVRSRVRHRRGHCPTCNYDLTGLDGVCPECGTPQ